jgi:uncharacterized protein (DUF1919 family)
MLSTQTYKSSLIYINLDNADSNKQKRIELISHLPFANSHIHIDKC